MRPRTIALVLSLSIAIVTAVPLNAISDHSGPFKSFLIPSFDDAPKKADLAFEAFNAVSSQPSYLIEFDLTPAGLNRNERLRMERNGEFEAFADTRHAVVSAQHQRFQSLLTDNMNVDYAVRHEFFDLINGLSIEFQDVSQNRIQQLLEQIRAVPGVVKVSPLISVSQPKTIVHDTGFDILAATPQLSTAHEQTGVLKAREELNLTGKGIKIGIIGPGCKVQYGYDFVEPSTAEEAGGFDCVGHGTHVAGIIAGSSTKSNFFGVAPEATLGTYRVFPCSGTAKDDVIIAALERAYRDGMEIVNLSLGGGSAWADTPLSKAAGYLAHLGVIVVAAIGNDGELGIDEVSSPSINENVISVASYEGSGFLANYFEVKGAPDVRIDYMDVPPVFQTGIPLVLMVPEHDPTGCQPYPDSADSSNPIAGKVALLKRGDCAFTSKQGETLLEQLEATPDKSITIVYSEKKGVFANELANQISTFSSWGLGPELELKPDVAGPGGYIYSTVPVRKGSFSTMSGTSMATPYVAGCAALMLQADTSIGPAAVMQRMQLYSKPRLYKDTSVPDSTARQGAGMVHAYDAIQGRAAAMPTHLALNDTDHTLASYTLTLTNLYASAEVFKISHVPAMSTLGYTPLGQPADAIVYSNSAAALVLDPPNSTVRLEAGESRSVTFRFTPPQDLDLASHWIYSGYVRMEPTLDTSRPAMQVPYAGMLGSYGTVDIMDLQEGFPILLSSTPDGKLMPIMDNNSLEPPTFTMAGTDLVSILFKISNPARSLHILVLDNRTQKVAGIVPVDADNIGRTDAVKTKFFGVQWNGKILKPRTDTIETVPDGDYSIVVLAPKPFSKGIGVRGETHESWMSPTIRIKREQPQVAR
ncbi:hypothetical protein BGZ70_000431 [Mortierella alpina]|uniref:Peptidase S8/S53 domain-containing protein n=1 Tax=Mortierella alpina TaxID=64518 RepID=A0A9P6IZS0_MORAP|nr:hypothetical protein BGZ70_000431 [Mortierella alpina]